MAVGALLGAPWVLAFSPTEFWFIGLFQLLALMLWVSKQSSARNSFFAGWAFGTSSLGIGVSWLYISLHQYGGLPSWFAVLSLFFFSLYLGLFAGLTSAGWHVFRSVWVGRWAAIGLPVAFASLWTFFEWFRGYFLSGFAWLSLGDVFVDSPVAGLLPWLGNHGTTFVLIWLVGAAVWPLWTRSRQFIAYSLLGVAMPLVAVVGLNSVDVQTEVAAEFTMAGVQTNVDQSIKFDPTMIVDNMEKVFALGDTALAMLPPDGALIFPETVNPLLWSDSPPSWLKRFRAFASDRPGVAITGGAIEEQGQYFNSVVLFEGHEQDHELTAPKTRHDKRHLVPFGETIPPGFHWFVRMMNMPMGEFQPGTGPLQPLLTQDNALAATVCYEDTFAGEFASLVRSATQEPTVFLNLSNLAWFGRSVALDQHAQMGRTRSAEHRKPTVRVTNTGVSGAIDEYGQWLNRVPSWEAKVWTAKVKGRIGLTPFAKYGHYLWFLIWMPVLVLLALGIVRIRAYNMAQTQKEE